MSKCRYYKQCEAYLNWDYVCNNKNEPVNYCRRWKDFEKERLSKVLIKDKVLFIIDLVLGIALLFILYLLWRTL